MPLALSETEAEADFLKKRRHQMDCLSQCSNEERPILQIQCKTSKTVTIEKPMHKPNIPPQLATNQIIGILWNEERLDIEDNEA